MHDFDNNTKLDGLEILKALTHLLPYEPDDEKKDDVRGKSAEEIAKQKREKELLYYAGDSARVYSTCVCMEQLGVTLRDSSVGRNSLRNGAFRSIPFYVMAAFL